MSFCLNKITRFSFYENTYTTLMRITWRSLVKFVSWFSFLPIWSYRINRHYYIRYVTKSHVLRSIPNFAKMCPKWETEKCPFFRQAKKATFSSICPSGRSIELNISQTQTDFDLRFSAKALASENANLIDRAQI